MACSPEWHFGQYLASVLIDANAKPDLYSRAAWSRGDNPLFLAFDSNPQAAQTYNPSQDYFLRQSIESRTDWDADAVIQQVEFALALWRGDTTSTGSQPGGFWKACAQVLAAFGFAWKISGPDSVMMGADTGGSGGGSGGKGIAQGIKGQIREAQLPTSGKIRFVPPKGATTLRKGPNYGYIDRFGNEWVKGPSRTAGEPFEWDVQLSRQGQQQLGWLSRDGKHLNVSLEGHVTH